MPAGRDIQCQFHCTSDQIIAFIFADGTVNKHGNVEMKCYAVKMSSCIILHCEDLKVMNNHMKLCWYPCGVEVCERVHKRLSEAISHKNKFIKLMK